MLEFIIKYGVEALLGIVFTAITLVIKKLYKKQRAIEHGVQALLRDGLIRRYREFEVKGEMTILDKENMELMFKEYENLGGNGMVKQMYDDMLKMPTKIIK